MTGGVRTGKAQNERMFSGLPPKADHLPILELLPPPALTERRHRRLARRLVAGVYFKSADRDEAKHSSSSLNLCVERNVGKCCYTTHKHSYLNYRH